MADQIRPYGRVERESENAVAVLQVKTGHVKVVASVVRPEFDRVVKWSPNGKQVGFIRCSGSDFQRCSVFAVSVNGSRPRQLARVPFGNVGFDWG